MTDSMAPSLERLLVALLIGILVGLERERAEARKERPLFAGVRTFPLIALAGAIPMLLPSPAGVALLVTTSIGIGVVAIVSYVRSSGDGKIGATTEITALATFLLGALAGVGQLAVAGAAGVAVAVLLAAKPPLERFSKALTTEEVSAVLELAVITVIVLPLLPNRAYGPWDALNPREIWVVVVLVSGLSFIGFVAMRALGARRGMAVTGAVGGLVSSTAVTISMAERSHAGAVRPAAASATVLASAIMCVRIAVLAGVINPGILPGLLPILAVMALCGGVAAWVVGRGHGGSTASDGSMANPFSLRAALTFAGVYAIVLVAVRAAEVHLGPGGIYLVSALSATVSVDAPTVALARLGGGSTGWAGPAAAIGVVAVTNTLVKLGIAVVYGAGSFRSQVGAALGVMALLGGLAGLGVLAGF
jgi:uncharacterized membrane protein (DUF4010 family)